MAVRLALQAMVEQKRKLDPDEAVAALHEIFSGNATPAVTGAFLVALQQQELDPALLRACADEMVTFASPCAVPDPASLMDIVGTGGDGHDTFNVSSAAGIVMAAAGVRCAKHGNRSASGSVGTADFLEALGCNLSLDGDQVVKAIEECSFGFVFAPCFHPAMKHVGAIRKELGVKTVFNYLGPLTNPARPSAQVIGVARRDLGPVFAEIFRLKGARCALIVHSAEGLDKISPCGPTDCWLLKDGTVTEMRLAPEAFGVDTHPLEIVQGKDAGERAALFRDVLTPGCILSPAHLAFKDFLIANAGAAIALSGKVAEADWKAGAAAARAVIEDGRAMATLDKYVAYSQACAKTA
mmetsp:Transcript_32160/g.73515  ORF Transcript_32160/g.73515 Transcript_32160/m.73515 type:complete len:353 (+) Transcript_32160:33-1091(+)|eukprot:CAMPEP_0180121472 /NCGR_PEP_ID=MMETSP0986-20121125/3065_1 /TAXON_ID=697907 /ORGANISM="non described non described, Strain CCMP2293" /LENGTH=352 /DNA_ID=CAMNT_0022060605 /DNA_START=32 /DNA_END=1090 /DNA_ORIENTATION=+